VTVITQLLPVLRLTIKGHVHIHVLPPHAFMVYTVVTFPFYLLCCKDITNCTVLSCVCHSTLHQGNYSTFTPSQKSKYCNSSLGLLNAIDNSYFFIRTTSPAPDYVILKYLSSKHKTVTTHPPSLSCRNMVPKQLLSCLNCGSSKFTAAQYYTQSSTLQFISSY
jgi:hypothetical protein